MFPEQTSVRSNTTESCGNRASNSGYCRKRTECRLSLRGRRHLQRYEHKLMWHCEISAARTESTAPFTSLRQRDYSHGLASTIRGAAAEGWRSSGHTGHGGSDIEAGPLGAAFNAASILASRVFSSPGL